MPKIEDNIDETVEQPIKKEAAIKPPPILHYFDVKVECMIPATLTYRVLAEDAYKAVELIKGKTPNSVSHKIIGRKEKVIKVYMAGSNLMKYMKNLFG